MKKIVLIVSLLISGLVSQSYFDIKKLFPNLTTNEITYYEKQFDNLENIKTEYEDFDTLTQEQKILLKNKVSQLISYKMIPINVQKWRKKHDKELLTLIAPLMNYQAYIIVDKYENDSKLFLQATLLARLVHNMFPKNLAYKDTYLWSQVKNGHYYEALKEYPALLKATSYDQDVKRHYEYVLQYTKFNPYEIIKKIKKIINNRYYTKTHYDKNILFEELDQIDIKDQDKFIKYTNNILKKYMNNEIVLLTQKKQKESKKTKQSYLKHNIKDGILYLQPHSLYLNLYNDIKQVLKNTKYNKIILDLQGNVGGALNSLLDAVSAFLPNDHRKLFIIQEQYNKQDYVLRQNKTIDTKTPLTIKIDDKTSRGAMYIASIFSKYKRANIVGKHSTNIDNTLQIVVPLKNQNDKYILLKFQIGYAYDTNMQQLKIYAK